MLVFRKLEGITQYQHIHTPDQDKKISKQEYQRACRQKLRLYPILFLQFQKLSALTLMRLYEKLVSSQVTNAVVTSTLLVTWMVTPEGN
jgi:hypothetical protein